jgi:hypothetical protein
MQQTIASLARANGVPPDTARRRVREGWSIADAVTKPPMPQPGPGGGVAALARANGINPDTARQRIHLGWTVERAVSTPVSARDYGLTITKRARDAELNPTTVRYRVKRGLSVEHALSIPSAQLSSPRRAWLNQEAAKLGISPHVLSARLGRLGWPVEQAISTPTKRQPKKAFLRTPRVNLKTGKYTDENYDYSHRGPRLGPV